MLKNPLMTLTDRWELASEKTREDDTDIAQTRRQSVAEILRSGPVTVLDLARRIGSPVKTLLDDLEHIRKSSKGKNRFIVRQPECNTCGFVFRDRIRLNAPSGCPRCGSEQIREPEFSITDPGSG